jgi:hypothetical protein
LRSAVLVILVPLTVGVLVAAAALLIPLAVHGKGRERGGSGVFLMGLIPRRAP